MTSQRFDSSTSSSWSSSLSSSWSLSSSELFDNIYNHNFHFQHNTSSQAKRSSRQWRGAKRKKKSAAVGRACFSLLVLSTIALVINVVALEAIFLTFFKYAMQAERVAQWQHMLHMYHNKLAASAADRPRTSPDQLLLLSTTTVPTNQTNETTTTSQRDDQSDIIAVSTSESAVNLPSSTTNGDLVSSHEMILNDQYE